MMSLKCRDCGGNLEAGFIPDAVYSHTSFELAGWYSGTPSWGWLSGFKVDRAKMHTLSAYRCKQCGLLKIYALPPEKKSWELHNPSLAAVSIGSASCDCFWAIAEWETGDGGWASSYSWLDGDSGETVYAGCVAIALSTCGPWDCKVWSPGGACTKGLCDRGLSVEVGLES